VYAALLAREGYTGVEDVLDVEYGGFFSTLVERYSPESLTRGLGTGWETLNVGFKLSPASNGSITAMHTLNRIMRDHGLSADDIEHVLASVSTNTLDHCGWEFDPAALKGVLAAQMNLRYGLAVMALDGVATPAQYAEARIKSRDIAAFLPKIEVDVLEAFDADASLRLACRLQVRARDGKTYEDETRYRPGSIEDPIAPEALQTKFMTLTSDVISPKRAAEWVSYIRQLDAHARVALPA
jgi:2-methylcitrate dehydratase PrpD